MGRDSHDPFCRNSASFPTRQLSFPFWPERLRVRRKNRISGKRCAEGAWSRNWNRQRCSPLSTHPVNGGGHGVPWNVCALDVGSYLTFSFYIHQTGACWPVCLVTNFKRANYSGRTRKRQAKFNLRNCKFNLKGIVKSSYGKWNLIKKSIHVHKTQTIKFKNRLFQVS